MKKVDDGDIDGMPEVTEEMRNNNASIVGEKKVDWSDMKAASSIFKKGRVELNGDVTVHQNGLIIQTIAPCNYDDDESGRFLEYQITNCNARYIKLTGVPFSRVEIEPEPKDGWKYWREFQPRDGGSRWKR